MNRGFLAALTLAASTIMAVSGQAQDAKFTNLMGRVPASNEIVEALITPLGIRFEALGDDATTADTEQLAAAELPATIALEVRFNFDSADLTEQAREVLTQLAVALKAPALAGDSFLVEGHTDAVGSSTYNKNLSDRRAAAVRNFLTSEHGIADERLIVVGVGENQLLNPSQPASPENRRVEVGNLGHQSASLQ